jgi:hypothetical protein
MLPGVEGLCIFDLSVQPVISEYAPMRLAGKTVSVPTNPGLSITAC